MSEDGVVFIPLRRTHPSTSHPSWGGAGFSNINTRIKLEYSFHRSPWIITSIKQNGAYIWKEALEGGKNYSINPISSVGAFL
jgi:hypothetical protein